MKKKNYILILFILLFFLYSGGAAAFELQVKIPGLDEKLIQPGGTTKPIGEYIRAVYNYVTGIVGILAVVVMMFGGIIWITAFGNAAKIGEAKAWIGAALTGLVLALTSFMIMQTINPALVNLKTNPIPTTKEILKIEAAEDNYNADYGGSGSLDATCGGRKYYTSLSLNSCRNYCVDRGSGVESFIEITWGVWCCECT